jgi:hypothetical protein
MGKLVRSPSRTDVIIVALLWWVDLSTGDERTMAWGVHWVRRETNGRTSPHKIIIHEICLFKRDIIHEICFFTPRNMI